MSTTMSTRIAAGVTADYLRDLTRRATPTVDAEGRSASSRGRGTANPATRRGESGRRWDARHDARRNERAVVWLAEPDRRPGLGVRGDRRVFADAGRRVGRRADDGVLSGRSTRVGPDSQATEGGPPDADRG